MTFAVLVLSVAPSIDPRTQLFGAMVAAVIAAFGAIGAAVVGGIAMVRSGRTDRELSNGTGHKLDRIEKEQRTQAKRQERMEGKIDRAHARINDLNERLNQIWRSR